MKNKTEVKYVLGLDTSNYTTSAALADTDGNIIFNGKKILEVKKGERGLRQSEALFQHWNNLPEIIREMKKQAGDIIPDAVSVSEKPRPIEGSYMPVFLAGINFADSLSAVLDIPLFKFSHQEGHIKASSHGSVLENSDCFVSYHLSGGTSELLLVKDDEIKIIGGTKDISFGQVIDRIGVLCGYSFPAGMYLDRAACSYKGTYSYKIKKPACTDMYYNLSGLETQCARIISSEKETDKNEVFHELFERISDVIIETSSAAVREYGAEGIVFAGGVSSSEFFRAKADRILKERGITFVFGDSSLSSDNAVGTALLGADRLTEMIEAGNRSAE